MHGVLIAGSGGNRAHLLKVGLEAGVSVDVAIHLNRRET